MITNHLRLPLIALRRDGGTQLRRRVVPPVVREYAALMREGAPFPPIVAFFDGETHWLADGFHRVAAAEQAGELEIAAEVRPRSQREALLFAAGANAQHGLRRTTADKQLAIRALLNDPEWSTWSDRELARHAGVDHKTVAAQRRALSGDLPQLPRVVRRGDAIYTMERRAAPLLTTQDEPRKAVTAACPETRPQEAQPPHPNFNHLESTAEIRDEILDQLASLQRQSRDLQHVAEIPAVDHDRWWRLDRHRLFSGRDQSTTFRSSIPQVPFAFVDLALVEPGTCPSSSGASAARSARELVWLLHRAEVLAVAVSTVAVPHYVGLPELAYRGAIAAVSANPQDDAAVATARRHPTNNGPDWIPVLLFSRHAMCPYAAATVHLPASSNAPGGNHRPALLAALLLHFTESGEPFVCLDAEAHQGYLLAEVMERACYGTVPGSGEAARSIVNWQRTTGKTAESFPYNRW